MSPTVRSRATAAGVIGKAETEAFLKPKPVRVIWGVGQATQTALETAGIRTIADLLRSAAVLLAAAHWARVGARENRC